MKRKLLFLFVNILLILPLMTKALTGSVIINCTADEAANGEEIICEISGKTNEEVSAVHGIVDVSQNLEIVSITKNSIWEGSSNNTTIDYYTDENKKDSFKIATVVLKGKSDGNATLSFKDVYYVDAKFDKNNINETTQKLTIATKTTNDDKSETNSNTENVDTPTENPKTGIVSIASLIVVGIVAGVALYLFKKKNIIHKI